MKKYLLLLFIPLLSSCSGTDTDKVKEEPCNLIDLREEGAGLWGFQDFTISNVAQHAMDEKGTYWEIPTNDEYRFVFKSDFDKVNLVIYKNKELLITYEDLKEKSRRHIPRLYPQCELDWLKEEVSTEWWAKTKSQTKPEKPSDNILDKIAAKQIAAKGEKILDLGMYKVSCYCTVWLYLDEKTKVYGSFKLHPQAGQECK